MLEGPPAKETQTFHQCERRDCDRIFRDGHGYSDFAAGEFDASRISSRECPLCEGTLYLAEADNNLKVETWECAEVDCNYSADIPSASSR